MNEEVLIDCWDLNDTILNKQQLFAPMIRRCAELAGISELRASGSLTTVAKVGLHFQDWFSHMGIDSALWPALETELRNDILTRGSSCVFPGVTELLQHRSLMAQQVLVTVGDPDFQKLKFASLGLDHIFAEGDRHYVQRDGSKAAVIGQYAAKGKVTFIDDREEWLREVSNQCPSVRCVRSDWSATTKRPRSGPTIVAPTIDALTAVF
jgi:hypothetical protein